MTVEKDLILEKLEVLEKLVTGNGDPEKGMIVSFVRMDQKLDAVLDKLDSHLSNKEIHRTELQSQTKMLKVAAFLLPVFLMMTVIAFWTLHGDWLKVGEFISRWLGI